jgi:tetratricopeptide (TPR) repeat protein
MSGSDTADYARLKHAFLDLLELGEEARAARLDEIERESPALAAALRRQIDAAAAYSPVLDRAAAAPDLPQLAQYRIQRELGRGGMGVVWLAERELGDARQCVALKQIAHAHWSPDDLRRFLRERRILATLDHPNIAALVDGGTDARGDAFLATQFVDGERLDRWCESQALGVRARLLVMRQIVAAAAYAHAKLVVHRDLKPANILVTREGTPKLLDFGIARALQEDAVTTEGPSQMTLRYAAPEQVASDGAEAGVSVDIYALGVLLYELLSRTSPYGEASGPAALIHAILHDEPKPPSRASQALTGVDADLDAICLKALRKRPEQRYAGANELLADLDRWLAREPVEARRGERGYRLRSFVRRRWVALTVSAVLLVLIAGLMIYEVNAQRAQIAALKLERDKARAISHFFDELFSSATPAEVQQGDVTARELLRRVAKRLEVGTTASMPDDARGALHKAASSVMVKQNLLPEAADMLDRAIQLWRGLPVAPVDDLAGALHERARIAYLQGEAELAMELESEAIAVMEAASGSDRASLAAMFNALSVMQWTSGKSQAAMTSLERAQSLLRPLLPDGRIYYANSLRNLATLQLYAGQAETALANAREAVAQVQQLKPERTAELLGNQLTVAGSLRELGRFDEAESLYRETIARARATLGENNPVVAEALNGYAKQWLLLEQWEQAEAALREVEAIHVAAGGPNHARALVARADLAWVAIGQQRWGDAERELRAVKALRGDAGRVEAHTLAGEAVALAYAACRNAERASAEHVRAMRQTVVEVRRNPPLPHARVALAERWLGECERIAAMR